MRSGMKKPILISIIIIALGFSAIIYFDFHTYNEKKGLYSDSLRIEQLLSKYNQILAKAEKVRFNYEALKTKSITDEGFNEFLKDSEQFLEKAKKIELKQNTLIKKYNEISERYNQLPKQKLFFKHGFPKRLNTKTIH